MKVKFAIYGVMVLVASFSTSTLAKGENDVAKPDSPWECVFGIDLAKCEKEY